MLAKLPLQILHDQDVSCFILLFVFVPKSCFYDSNWKIGTWCSRKEGKFYPIFFLTGLRDISAGLDPVVQPDVSLTLSDDKL
jgi:hypothetical protein